MRSVILVLISLIVHLAHAERVSGPDGKVYTYKEIDGIKRELEIYFPERHDLSSDPVPAIIFFHGGDGEVEPAMLSSISVTTLRVEASLQ